MKTSCSPGFIRPTKQQVGARTLELLGTFQGYKNQSNENKPINTTKMKYC